LPEPHRLVVATTDFRPMVGGVSDHMHQIAQSLAGRAEVTVRTSVPQNGAAWDRAYALESLAPLPERELGRRLGDGLPPVRRLHTGMYFLRLRQYADRMVADLAQRPGGPPPVLIGIWDTASHFWCAACRRAGIPYYLAAYGVELLMPLYGRLPAWRREDFTRATKVLACSRATADLAAERLGLAAPPAVVHPIAGPRPPAPGVEARATMLRRSLDLDAPDSGPVLLSVGRQVPRKGFDLVLRSVAELQPRYPHLRYVLVGNGPERMRLEKLASELGIASKVKFLGQADEITKWAAYELCDLFVMPNRLLGGTEWEGFGIVFVEAALAGRPVVAGRSGGTADAVIDQQTGLLVNPEEDGALTGALRRLLDDGALRRRFGEEGARMARDRCSTDRLATRLQAELGWA
jgi:phosphatidylinositol alpha-1,6-mannosyltransferase